MRVKKKSGAGQKRRATHFDERSAIAMYYGFIPRDIRLPERDTLAKLKKMIGVDQKKDSEIMQAFDSVIHLEEKLVLMQEVVNSNANLSQPLAVYYNKTNTSKKTGKIERCGLEIIGTGKSIAEATLIKTALEMLKEAGYENLFIEINSLGDKESLIRLTRELTAYYRRHINDLPAPCRQLLKRDVFEVLLYPHEKCILLKNDAPKPMNYLSEISREHFREVLEFLERMEVPYQIISSLVGNRKYTSYVVFEIKRGELGSDKNEILARGIRYNGLAKKLGSRKEIPAVGVALSFKPLRGKSGVKVGVKKSKIYFIQLGFEAKLKSLKVIEMLRKEKIPLQQSLSKDKLATQLATAEHLKIPYVLIMGQKEAMENSVIVRTMSNRSQETVPVDNLPRHLNRLS